MPGDAENVQAYLGRWYTIDLEKLPPQLRADLELAWMRFALQRSAYREAQAKLDDLLVDAKVYS